MQNGRACGRFAFLAQRHAGVTDGSAYADIGTHEHMMFRSP
jgi:hypothetical protein